MMQIIMAILLIFANIMFFKIQNELTACEANLEEQKQKIQECYDSQGKTP